MLKKISLVLVSVVISALSLFSSAAAVETQFVYVENLTISNQAASYKPGDKIEGTFVLRNAGEKDAANIFYNVLLTEVDTSRPDMKGYLVVSEKKYGPIAISAKSKSAAFEFSLDVPSTAVGEKFEIKVESVSSVGTVLSWADSSSFLVSKSDSLSSSIDLVGAHLELDNGISHGLQTGPMIYSDKDPKLAYFKTNILNKHDQAVTVEVYAEVSKKPFSVETISGISEKVKLTIQPQGNNLLSIKLPTNEYVPGIYEGKVYFKDVSGKEIIPPSNFRYIIGGEIATIHSLTTDKSSLSKNEDFVIIASITGTPFDVDRFLDENSATQEQNFVLNLTVLNENGTIIAQEVTQNIDLSKTDRVEFKLTALKNAKAIKGIVTVNNRNGEVILQYESNLSADYDARAAEKSKKLFLLLLVVCIGLTLIFLFTRFKKKLPVVSTKTINTISALFVSAALIGFAFYTTNKTLATSSPFGGANYTYNTNDSVAGLVYKELFSFYAGTPYEGSDPNRNHFVNNNWGPRLTSNFPIDSEFEVGAATSLSGRAFNVGVRVDYAICGNTPVKLHVSAIASSDTLPSNTQLGLNAIADSTSGLTKVQAKTMFVDNLRLSLTADSPYAEFPPSSVCSTRGCRFATESARQAAVQSRIDQYVAQFETTVAPYVENGKIKPGGYYVETVDFGSPVDGGSIQGRGVHTYNFSKNMTAPMTPGIHKLWIGSVVKGHLNTVAICYLGESSGMGKCGSVGTFRSFSENYWSPMTLGYVSDKYIRVKAYQTYKVLPPAPATFTATTGAACGTMDLAWTQKSVFQAGQVNFYKLYRKTSVDADFTLVTSTIPGDALSYTDTLPAGTVGNVNYRLVALHSASGLESTPIEASGTGVVCSDASQCQSYSMPVTTAPGADRCISGVSGAVTLNPSNNRYEWTCTAPSGTARQCSVEKAETIIPTIPSTPSITTEPTGSCPTVNGFNTISFSISTTASSTVTFNVLRRVNSSTGPNTQIGTIEGSASGQSITATYRDATAVPGQTYRYQVTATNSAGTSEPSSARTGTSPATCQSTTVASAPVFTGSSFSCGSVIAGKNTINLSFKSVSGSAPASFHVFRKTSSETDYTEVGAPAATANRAGELTGSFVDTNATAGVTYNYRLNVTNQAGTSAFSSVRTQSTPAVCEEVRGVCGDATTQIMYSAPEGPNGLCEIGEPQDGAFDQAENKFTWTCGAPNGDTSCFALKADVGEAECGSADGGTYADVPDSNQANLCNPGISSAPEVSGPDRDSYKWNCTSTDGQIVRRCTANKQEIDDEDPEAVRASCGFLHTQGSSVLTAPTSGTAGLCGTGSQLYGNIRSTQTSSDWQCALTSDPTNRINRINCDVNLTDGPPPEIGCTIGTAGCPPQIGEVELGTLRAHPSIVNKGRSCKVDARLTPVGIQSVFVSYDGNTRCQMYGKGNEIGGTFIPSTGAEGIFDSSSLSSQYTFKLKCWQVTVDAVTGAETPASVPDDDNAEVASAVCRINPAYVETSFFKRIFIGFKDMGASAFDAFAKFFNLR